MMLQRGNFAAIFGGACSGSEAASRLAQSGVYVAVFEQHAIPYGKIEDGLPKWHVKLRDKEEGKIDERISKKDNLWKKYAPSKQSYYTFQVSSLSNRSFALANLNSLKNKLYPAYILLVKNKDEEMVYKLRIGKYETKAKAKRAAERFYKKEKMKYIILKSNADISL